MANWWTLKVISGPHAGKEFPLRQDRSVVGRTKGDVVLQDDEASSVHADIVYDRDKGLLIIQDLKSRNGTRVNGQVITLKVLSAGDKIRIGVTELVLEPPTSDETVVQSADAGEARRGDAPAKKRSKPMEPAPIIEHPKVRAPRERPARDPAPIDIFFRKILNIFLAPNDFFAGLAHDDHAKPAFVFALIVLTVGSALAFGTQIGVERLLKMAPAIPNPLMTGPPLVAAGMTALSLLIGVVIGLPVGSAIFHVVSLILGGRAPFKKAFQVTCYLSVVHVFASICGPIPKFGGFLQLLPIAYTMYLLAVASVRVYGVGNKAAYIFCGIVTPVLVYGIFSSQQAAHRLQFQMAGAGGQAQPPAATAPAPAAEEKPAADQQQQRDPATNTGDQGAAPSAPSDPEPPKMPSSN
jgi:hypothetical protein